MRIPPFLSPGDTVAIVATARWVDPEPLGQAIRHLESWGYRVITGAHVSQHLFQLAGTDTQRRSDFQSAIDNPDVKAVLIARGGYGTVRMIDGINWENFRHAPKWICGYSDITVLHAIVNGFGIASLHSVNALDFTTHDPQAIASLGEALAGNHDPMTWQAGPHSVGQLTLGPLPVLGGNLSVLFSLLGSGSYTPAHDHFLLLEDVSEYLYHIDRMLMGLKRSGSLQHTRAILCGGFTEMKDNTREFQFSVDNPWGTGALEMVANLAGELGIPVVTGLPVGHFKRNMACLLGVPSRIELHEGMARLTPVYT